MMNTTWRKETLFDIVNAVVGTFLFASPWLFGFATEQAASWNAWLSGIVVAGLAIAALASFMEWEEWMTLVVGLWVVASPWLVAFSGIATAMWLHVIAGAIVAIAAGVRLWLTHEHRPRVRA